MNNGNNKRQQLIDMARGNGRSIEEVPQPDGSTTYILHIRHNGYHRQYDCKSKEEVQDIIALMDSDI